jgi:hypothetical protein
MWSAATVLVCTLELLGRGAGSFPSIVLLDARPADVSSRAEAFIRHGDPTIYVMTTGPAFARARRALFKCGDREALVKLASILVHEESHLRKGTTESEAYIAQLTTLIELGSMLYAEVSRSRREVLAQAKRLRAGR